MDVNERRALLRVNLITAAEGVIAQGGLPALRARDLAAEAGCAVGAIYTVFPDLDALILAVSLRTLALFESEIARSGGNAAATECRDPETAIDELVRLALTYFTFARANAPRWRALFQHRMASGLVPDWYRSEQGRLFRYIEGPLARLCPDLTEAERKLRARSLFSATHGLVSLGMDEKLMALSPATLAEELETVVRALGRGLASQPAP